jgi:hypothetical protein
MFANPRKVALTLLNVSILCIGCIIVSTSQNARFDWRPFSPGSFSAEDTQFTSFMVSLKFLLADYCDFTVWAWSLCHWQGHSQWRERATLQLRGQFALGSQGRSEREQRRASIGGFYGQQWTRLSGISPRAWLLLNDNSAAGNFIACVRKEI